MELPPELATPETINPYRIALGLLARRIMWDLRPVAWTSRRSLGRWKDRHQGKKAVILCNGPSLLKSDLSLLGRTFTFGLNKVRLLIERTGVRPSCVVAVNPLVIQQEASFFAQTELPVFLGHVGTKHVRRRHNITFLHTVPLCRYARDCRLSIFEGFTVTFVALQLAYHMGFQEVALIGCDHQFTAQGTPNALATATGPDTNHFDPRYFADGTQWHLPDLAQSEVAYRLARAEYEAAGRRVVNATEGGRLETFPRIPLQDFLD